MGGPDSAVRSRMRLSRLEAPDRGSTLQMEEAMKGMRKLIALELEGEGMCLSIF